MIGPPAFPSTHHFVAHLGDAGFWEPYVREALGRHGLDGPGRDPEPGHNATYPTFVCGDVVVKLFGRFQAWRAGYESERAAYALIATDPEIAAPRVLGDGHLFEDGNDPWPYLVTSRMPGTASWRANLSEGQWRRLAEDVGQQVRRLHALPPSGGTTQGDWPGLDMAAALRASSLPPHLIAQADAFLGSLPPVDQAFVHGDITANHVYVENGRLVGLIDWGDALVADRHTELIQIYRDLFRCDRALFGTFLMASQWPVGPDFPRLALGHALHRQCIGFAQHHSMDVFEPIAARYPLDGFATLDDLADALFAG